MKILYIANIRMPTEMAHGLQIMKMCEAFVKQGASLELVIPRRFSISSLGNKDPFEYYKVDKIFKIKKLFCLDLTPLNRFLGPVSFLIQAISFAISVFFYTLFKSTRRGGERVDIIYSRDRFSSLFIASIKQNVVLEIHQIHKSLFKFILNRVQKIIVITDGLKRDLVKKGIKENKIMIAGDAIDLNDFNVTENKEECREKLGLPIGKKIVLYAGHLYKWKGVETLALASKYLGFSPLGVSDLVPNPQSLISDYLIVIVGGIKWYLSDFKKFVEKNNLKNVLVLGHKDYSLIPTYLKSADCLILTGTNDSETSQKYTSPMKMFEYMASKNPIVASDLPSFREILYDSRRNTQIESRQVENTQINADISASIGVSPQADNQRVSAFANAILVESDNPEAMAMGVKKALNDTELSKKISEQAFQDVQKYTWDNRAREILKFITD